MQRLIGQTKALKGAPSTRFSTSSPATGQPAEQRGLRYGAFNFPHLASNKEMTRARQNGVEEVSLIQTYLSSSLSLSLYPLRRPSKREPISSVSPLLLETCQFIARSRNDRFFSPTIHIFPRNWNSFSS